MIDYKIIQSGSDGNAVRINNIMIDCGVSFNKMKKELYKCDTLLITHNHSDHIKRSTLDIIRKEFPRIRVYANPTVAYEYPVDEIICERPFTLPRHNDIVIYPFEGLHDTEVTYYVIKIGDINIIYATDTAKVENKLGLKFDYCFIESNYDEVKLKQIAGQYAKGNYNPLTSNIRHLSTQQCKTFYYVNRRDTKSELIELHKSKRFY